jgi:hypothetical protein
MCHRANCYRGANSLSRQILWKYATGAEPGWQAARRLAGGERVREAPLNR